MHVLSFFAADLLDIVVKVSATPLRGPVS